MKYVKYIILCFGLSIPFIFGCASKLSPINEYRLSKPYQMGLIVELGTFDSVQFNKIVLRSGVVNSFRLREHISLSDSSFIKTISNRLYTQSSIPISIVDSIKVVRSERFAFNDHWRRKKDFSSYYDFDGAACQIIPFAEIVVFTALETEGGGGMEMVYTTGNRIHNILQGVVLTMFCDGRQVFSSGYYYTDLFKNSKDSLTVYDFPIARLDSLVGLCLEDLDKAVKNYAK